MCVELIRSSAYIMCQCGYLPVCVCVCQCVCVRACVCHEVCMDVCGGVGVPVLVRCGKQLQVCNSLPFPRRYIPGTMWVPPRPYLLLPVTSPYGTFPSNTLTFACVYCVMKMARDLNGLLSTRASACTFPPAGTFEFPLALSLGHRVLECPSCA